LDLLTWLAYGLAVIIVATQRIIVFCFINPSPGNEVSESIEN
jgi:hypothetical protein